MVPDHDPQVASLASACDGELMNARQATAVSRTMTTPRARNVSSDSRAQRCDEPRRRRQGIRCDARCATVRRGWTPRQCDIRPTVRKAAPRLSIRLGTARERLTVEDLLD